MRNRRNPRRYILVYSIQTEGEYFIRKCTMKEIEELVYRYSIPNDEYAVFGDTEIVKPFDGTLQRNGNKKKKLHNHRNRT